MNTINLHNKEILTTDMLIDLSREFYHMISQEIRDWTRNANFVNSNQYQVYAFRS